MTAAIDAVNALIIWALSVTRREEGQTMAEYGLILAGIAILVMVAVGVLSGQISATFQAISDCLATPASCA